MTAIKTCDYSAEVPVGSVAFPPACDACRIRTCARNAWHARFRIGEERFGVVGLFNDAAVLQHDHLVGDGSCELHLVRHDEHGLAGIGEFQHHVKHLAHHFRIKRGGDLVEQQHFRMQDQRTADGHALALASGQLMRPGILAVGESDAFQQSDGFLLDLRLVALLHERRSERDVAEHGFVGEQVVALEHHADTRAQLAAALAAAGRFGARLAGFDNLAVQRDGAALNRLRPAMVRSNVDLPDPDGRR